MACRCGGRNKRLPAIRSTPGPTEPGQRTQTWWYAIPPEGEVVRFATLREARQYAQRQKGPGWTIDGRAEPVVD